MNKLIKQIYGLINRQYKRIAFSFSISNKFRNRKIEINYGKKSVISKTILNCKGKRNVLYLGDDTILNKCKVFIRGNNNSIYIGNNSKLIDVELWIEGDNNSIVIGDYTSFMGKTHIACIESTTIQIGNNCLFSSDVTIRSGDSHTVYDTTTNKRINASSNVVIGNHVWVGNKTIILKGSEIKPNSIVGSGAVVSKTFVASGCVIAGNPARVVKEQVSWAKERWKV